MHQSSTRQGFVWVLLAHAAVLFVAMLSLPSEASAQAKPATQFSNSEVPVKFNVHPAKAEIRSTSDNLGWMSTKESALSISVLLFGFSLSLMQVWIIKQSTFTPNDVVRLFGLTFIVTAVLFIITAGYGAEQIAPAMGLFGTVAGYILGRNQGGKDDQAD